MEALVPFVAGVVVGAVAVILLRTIRRSSPVESPTALRPTGSTAGAAAGPLDALLHELGTTTHSQVTVVGRSSVIRMGHGGGPPIVEIDGTTYHRMADVPDEARELLLDELRVVRDTPNLPADALAGLDAFLGDDDGGSWHVHPESEPDAPEPPGS